MSSRAHLHRLSRIWIENPVYFVTQCTAERRSILGNATSAEILRTALADADHVHGWVVGRFVIMPDHVHFFARPKADAKPLSNFMRDWKRWTSRKILSVQSLPAPLWQPEFFDHLLRSAQSYAEKWEYVRENPVRAGLVTEAEAWPFAGECQTVTF